MGAEFAQYPYQSQGLSARSFIDWKLKGSLWVSGGFEMNYRSEFQEF
ncbi:MAG: hypothetical protein IPN39_10300 [Chitinophagaceae bacterium]|nr:hypothetical protein [Chitinophagaceae bacterium]